VFEVRVSGNRRNVKEGRERERERGEWGMCGVFGGWGRLFLGFSVFIILGGGLVWEIAGDKLAKIY